MERAADPCPKLLKRYQSAVGGLLYCSTNTRPDTAFAVGMLYRAHGRAMSRTTDARAHGRCIACAWANVLYSGDRTQLRSRDETSVWHDGFGLGNEAFHHGLGVSLLPRCCFAGM
eukprot:3221437-Prymnesium_polylepis.2